MNLFIQKSNVGKVKSMFLQSSDIHRILAQRCGQ